MSDFSRIILGAPYGAALLVWEQSVKDGPEVDIIRREMQIAAGVSLHWADGDGHILCPPMTTDEACQKGIQL